MALTERVPLMQPGATVRNVLVILLYFVIFPFIIIAIPFFLLYAVGTNRNGLADTLADSPLGAIPTIEAGGWQAGITVFVIAIVLLGVVGAALPETDTTGDPSALNDTGPGNDDGESTTETQATSSPAATEPPVTDGGTATDAAPATDAPTDEPTTSPTAAPTATATPEPSVTTLQSIRSVDNRYDDGRQQFSGTGQTVTDTFSHGGPAMVVVFDHDGSSNFIVELVNAETGETEDVLVNKIGETSGAIAIPAGSSDQYRLNIDADGAWSVEVAEPLPQEEDIEQLPAEASGSGPDVVGPIRLEGNTVVSGTHDGESNFIVRAVDELAMFNNEQELIFNEIGQFEGETLARYDGVVWISVEADGEWTLEFE